jgi:hypothetical protein
MYAPGLTMERGRNDEVPELAIDADRPLARRPTVSELRDVSDGGDPKMVPLPTSRLQRHRYTTLHESWTFTLVTRVSVLRSYCSKLWVSR